MASPVVQPVRPSVGETVTEVLLIRHGQSATFVPGDEDSGDPALSDIGRAQAERLVERLAGKHLDAIYASNLTRAVETAERLAESRGIPVQRRDELREVELGEWENGVFRQHSNDRTEAFLAFLDGGRWDAIPGAEVDEVLHQRATAVVDEIIATHPGGTVAIVCHGGFIQGYLCGALGIARSLWAHIENTSITVVHADRHHRVVITVGDCHHVYDPVLGPLDA